MHPAVQKMNDLGVACRQVGHVVGPQIERIELVPVGDSRMHDFRKLSRADDLAFALGVQSVRILAPIPGRSAVGLEFDRKDRKMVTLDDLPNAHAPLCVPLGLDTDNQPVLLVLDEAPHMLVAGATGSGKSTCLNAMLTSLLSALSPEQLKLILIDPKRVEMNAYEDISHLAAPIADDAAMAVRQLYGAIENMGDRYTLMKAAGAQDLKTLNEILENKGLEPLPRLLIVVDELAELMMLSKKEVETMIVRLAQKGRAAGIHLVLATQSPRSEVFTGLISANIPTRIGFQVAKQVDSRVIMDSNGCEKLLGAGDGLFSFGGLVPIRFQGAYCSREEIESVTSHWRGIPVGVR